MQNVIKFEIKKHQILVQNITHKILALNVNFSHQVLQTDGSNFNKD